MGKKIGLIAMAVFSVFSARSQQDSIYTLKRCIEISIENNLSLQKQGQNIEKDGWAVKQNRASLLPQIQAFGSFTDYVDKPTSLSLSSQIGMPPTEGQPYVEINSMQYHTSGGLKMSMPLYNQVLYTSLHIARQMQEISRLSYEKAREDLIQQVARQYYQIQTTLEQTQLANENIRRLSELRAITQASYDNGMALEIDVQRVDINLENTTVQHDNLLSFYEQQLNLLRYVMGISPEVLFRVEAYRDTEPLRSPMDKGFSNDLYEIQLVEAQQRVLDLKRASIKQGYLPALSFVGQLGYTKYADHFGRTFNSKDTPGWYNSFYWGLSLNIPVFDGFDKKMQLRQNKVALLQNRLQLQDTRTSLQTQYDNAVNDYLNNQRNVKKQKDNYLLAEDVYAIAMEKYKEGIASMTELLQDEIAMSNAQTSYVNAHYNYKTSVLQLLKLSRQLDTLMNY